MTDIRLYNTLSRQKEIFKPLDPDNVRMYVCGPTVYDFAHLGNARPVVVFDTLYRLLKRHYPKVTYVRNITDVDDKIMAKAAESGEPIGTITERTIKAFHEDMAALNALPPDIEPLCTAHIPQMITMIEVLIAKGHAYEAQSHVLFNVPSMPEYGRLSRRPRDELITGARVEVAPYKKDPADFVLWKPSSAEQVGWDSPWGWGRPGWHIECSAMAKEHLGTTFDIHGGGLDLIFPHHENEIAQSRCAHDGAELAQIWMHNGFLTIDNDKMSKSLGNFFTVRDLLNEYHGEVIRLTLLSGHYRSPLDFSRDALTIAKKRLDKFYGSFKRAQEKFSSIPPNPNSIKPIMPDAIEGALSDDLNTPLALSCFDGLISEYMEPAIQNGDQTKIDTAIAYVRGGADALGLLQQDPEQWFKWQPADRSGPGDDEIEAQITARLAARKAKNFAASDRIRDALKVQGVVLEDGPGGTTWRRG